MNQLPSSNDPLKVTRSTFCPPLCGPPHAWQTFWAYNNSCLCICGLLLGSEGREKVTQAGNMLAANQKLFCQGDGLGMIHCPLKARILPIKLGADTLEPMWVMVTQKNAVTCMRLCNLSLNHAFIHSYADTFSVAHICLCMCVRICACVCHSISYRQC